MMKRTVLVLLVCMSVTVAVVAQEEQRIDITSFEEEEFIDSWAYTGSSILESYVALADELPEGIQPQDGNNVLYVEYDNAGSEWQWSQLNLQGGNMDLTGMREIHMWVYWMPDSVPDPDNDFEIRIDFPGDIGLGYQSTTTTGEWVEFVWNIDRLTSAEGISDVWGWGGFIAPRPGEAQGALYIDNIYAVRPAGTPELETILLYGFDEEDPGTGFPTGWTASAGTPFLGEGTVTPTQGGNHMVITLGADYINNVATLDAMSDYDRWPDVVEVLVDVMIDESPPGGWINFLLILESGVDGVPDAPDVDGSDPYAEMGIAGTTDDWKTLLWEVDMSRHKGAFEQEGGWFNVVLNTNNSADDEGILVHVDNFRVSVPVVTGVSDWSLF